MFKWGATTVGHARPVLSLQGSPLFLLFLQEINSGGPFLNRGNARFWVGDGTKNSGITSDAGQLVRSLPIMETSRVTYSHAMVGDDRKLMPDMRLVIAKVILI
jgi:hypothetical protein